MISAGRCRSTTALGDAALLACAIGWGVTFPLTRAALQHATPLALTSVRFLIAAVVLAPLACRPSGVALRRAAGWGALLGALLTVGFGLQAFGLTRINSARSAFLTAFYVLFTPLLEWGLLRRRPGGRALAGATIALVGVAVMTGTTLNAAPNLGDWATLLCALAFAAQMVALSSALRRHASQQILLVEIACCGVLAGGAALLFETPRFSPDATLLGAVAFLSLGATVLLLAAQNYGQRRTTPTRAAVLFSSEPVWATIFAAAAGEQLAAREIGGAALVLTGLLVATLPQRGRNNSAGISP